MKIILASSNYHKKKELEQILPEHELVLATEAGFDMDYEETGHTYFENSFGKALHIIKQGGVPVLADDSGLSVSALQGAPGIYSARYGSQGTQNTLSTEDRNQLLLDNMTGITDRTAFFICAMVFMKSEYNYYAFQETLEGIIGDKPAGDGGFGYDPLLYLPEFGRTVAEIPVSLKNRISHRGKAGTNLNLFLKYVQ